MVGWVKAVVAGLAMGATVVFIVLMVVKVAEYGARQQMGWGIATLPGPVTPTPNIEEHVAAVMGQGCPPCPECPTWQALKRAGVEIVCGNAFGAVPTTNYWGEEMEMGCSRIREVRITDGRIKVIGGKR